MLSPQIWPTNPVLRRPSDPVRDFWPYLYDIFENLREVMYANKGVGISAPQIGINKQILIATNWDEKSKKNKPGKNGKVGKKNKDICLGDFVVMNPEIITCDTTICTSDEWCVSLPGIFGKVPRYKSITIRYMDERWESHTKEFSWFTGYIIQHEIDHLNGILFVDKMTEEIKKKK